MEPLELIDSHFTVPKVFIFQVNVQSLIVSHRPRVYTLAQTHSGIVKTKNVQKNIATVAQYCL